MEAEALSGRRDCKVMACLNPHSYASAREDPSFDLALKGANWLIPDGVGVILAARWLGLPIRRRVSGPDVFLALMERLSESKGSVFLLGSSEATLAKIREKIGLQYPGVIVAGTYSPPFKDEFSVDENLMMLSAVNLAQPDVLWVGMTAPKQEKWLAEHRDNLIVGAAGAVGAAFDFFAGTVKRPPRLVRAWGLEWLLRLVQQPRRLWRRMLISAPAFLIAVIRYRCSRQDN